MKEFDDDIEKMKLGYDEKSGLQMYRNYTRAFDEFGEKRFREDIDGEIFDTNDLKQVLDILSIEDVRFLPIVVCGYSDDLLQKMCKAAIPKEIPGGISDLFGQYGPIATLNQRIKLCYIANFISRDLLHSLDLVRKSRNKLSHNWSIDQMKDFFRTEAVKDLTAIDVMLSERAELERHFQEINALAAFRVRLVWLIARLTYEAPLYHRAITRRLQPDRALFGPNAPARLKSISKIALDCSLCITETL